MRAFDRDLIRGRQSVTNQRQSLINQLCGAETHYKKGLHIMSTQVTGPEAPKQYVMINIGDDVESMLRHSIEVCANYYHGHDLAEDAIDIAKLVICTGEEDEDTAERILGSMGYIASAIVYWKDLKPETIARAKQIRALALPGYGD
jgi:hypothetical protein